MQRLDEEIKVNEFLVQDQLPKDTAAINKQIAYSGRYASSGNRSTPLMRVKRYPSVPAHWPFGQFFYR